MEVQPIRLMIVDDQAMVRRGMKAFLDEYEGISVIGETAGGAQAIQLIAILDPDVVLIDLLMPEMDGIETIRRIIAIRPELRIIVLTAYKEGDKMLQAIKAGAMGYLVKDANPEELIRAIQGVYAGLPAFDNMVLWNLLSEKTDMESYEKINDLTEREMEVLQILAKGYSDDEIAEQLGLSKVTVRTHISRILAKLGLKNRVQAALYIIRSGLVTLDKTQDQSKTSF